MAIGVQGLCPLLEVFDMPASVKFYRDVLGFEIVATSESGSKVDDNFDWGLLRLNDAELMLNTAYERHNRPQAPDPVRVAAHRDTALYFGCPDPDAAYRQLRAAGLSLKEPVITHYGMKQLYLLDPDGYTLCFQCPASGS